MGQITSKMVRMGLRFSSKQSLFGWLGHFPIVGGVVLGVGVGPLNKIFFFITVKMEFKEVTRHFKGATESPKPVSKVNSTRIRARSGHFRSSVQTSDFSFLLESDSYEL